MAPIIVTTDYIGLVYAALLAVGGLIGGLRRGSKVSLIAGLGSSLAAAYGADRVSKNSTDVLPALITSSALFLLMGYRYTKSGKFMPAGLVTVLSALVSIRYFLLKP
ncbi:uncharacterized protein IL334_001815 [Kwoniella shivajii]|uniref:Transmembrane protein 14 n=1 Tax=Kwoniella shivajii TaxID=564305 RepID=A0ABZ1CUL4_9TREE|nr:hypothetical protein IL334_001815 [Kwoniella shivajii]